MKKIAIIGGSGLEDPAILKNPEDTPAFNSDVKNFLEMASCTTSQVYATFIASADLTGGFSDTAVPHTPRPTGIRTHAGLPWKGPKTNSFSFSR